MKLFHSTYDEYYDAGVGEFPLPIRCVRNVALAIVWAFALCMWRARMEDERYMLERSDGKGTVIICNHTSMAEVVSICTYLRRRGRIFRPIFKSEFGSHRIVEWVFSRAGGIPVERGTADMKSLRRAQHALQRGRTFSSSQRARAFARMSSRSRSTADLLLWRRWARRISRLWPCAVFAISPPPAKRFLVQKSAG